MFRTLHLKMTIFCTVVTGIILVGMTLTGLHFFISLLDRNDAVVYDKNLSSILTYMDGKYLIDYEGLANIADNRFYAVTFYENDTVFCQYRKGWQADVAAFARKKAQEEYGFDVQRPVKTKAAAPQLRFEMEYRKQEYLVTAVSIPNKYSTLSALVIFRREMFSRQRQQLQMLFFVIDVLAVLILFLFAWIFTGRMLCPLEENQKKQNMFIASASHELRSPLAVILSSADALKVADEGDRPGFCDAISSEGLRMARLIDDMLSLAGADSKSWTVQFAPAELDTMLLELYETYQPLFRSQQILLKIDLPKTAVLPVKCDRQRIWQVMGILLDNARSYTPKGGRVTVGIRQENSRTRLWVSDTGPGVLDVHKEQIFDRFFCADPARNGKNHFGLGLCIAKEIVKLHHGKIWVEDGTGGGAVFNLLLQKEP